MHDHVKVVAHRFVERLPEPGDHALRVVVDDLAVGGYGIRHARPLRHEVHPPQGAVEEAELQHELHPAFFDDVLGQAVLVMAPLLGKLGLAYARRVAACAHGLRAGGSLLGVEELVAVVFRLDGVHSQPTGRNRLPTNQSGVASVPAGSS